MVALIVFGPGKLPEVAKSIGRGVMEFRKMANKASDTINDVKDETKDIKEGMKKEIQLDKEVNLIKNENLHKNNK